MCHAESIRPSVRPWFYCPPSGRFAHAWRSRSIQKPEIRDAYKESRSEYEMPAKSRSQLTKTDFIVRFMQFRITLLLIIYSIPCRVCHKKLLAGRMLDHISGTCLGAWKWSTYIVGTCLSHFWHMFGWKRSQELMLYHACMYVSDSDVCFVSNIFTPCYMQITCIYTDKNVLTAGAPYTASCHILWKLFYFSI